MEDTMVSCNIQGLLKIGSRRPPFLLFQIQQTHTGQGMTTGEVTGCGANHLPNDGQALTVFALVNTQQPQIVFDGIGNVPEIMSFA